MERFNNAGIPIADAEERKYIVVSRLFAGFSAAASPCAGQVATNSRLVAYFLYKRWNRFSRTHIYSTAVMLLKRNESGLYDAIKR